MELSECKLGLVVQGVDNTYDEMMSKRTGFGHILGFEVVNNKLCVVVQMPDNHKGFINTYLEPHQIKPLED